jgi:hypothetical protein
VAAWRPGRYSVSDQTAGCVPDRHGRRGDELGRNHCVVLCSGGCGAVLGLGLVSGGMHAMGESYIRVCLDVSGETVRCANLTVEARRPPSGRLIPVGYFHLNVRGTEVAGLGYDR